MLVSTRLVSPSLPQLCLSCGNKITSQPVEKLEFKIKERLQTGWENISFIPTTNPLGNSSTMKSTSFSYLPCKVDVEFPICGTCAGFEKNFRSAKDRSLHSSTIPAIIMAAIATIYLLVSLHFKPAIDNWFLYLIVPGIICFIIFFIFKILLSSILFSIYRKFQPVDPLNRKQYACIISTIRDGVDDCTRHDELIYNFRNDEYGKEFKNCNASIQVNAPCETHGKILENYFGYF